MAREDFIRNIWDATYELSQPRGWTESPYGNADNQAITLRRADLWLAPQSVEGFHPDDFTDVSPKQRDELSHAVQGFLDVATKVPPTTLATKKQFQEARKHVEKIAAIVRESVRSEWTAALDRLVRDAETWSRNQDWSTKRDTKRLTEVLLGTYNAPRLLIHTVDGRLLLDPVSRFVMGAEGSVELCVMPSYDSARIVRIQDRWYLLALQSNGRRQNWSEETFRKTVKQLLVENA